MVFIVEVDDLLGEAVELIEEGLLDVVTVVGGKLPRLSARDPPISLITWYLLH
jgi:hypothetical protein